MNKFSTPKKEVYNRIATVVMVVFMFIWTIGSILGIMAFFRPKDNTVKASALNTINDNLPYCYYIPAETVFDLTDDPSGLFSTNFSDNKYVPMVLNVFDYVLPVVLVNVDVWSEDLSYQNNVLAIHDVDSQGFKTVTDYYFFTYQDLSYYVDIAGALEMSSPLHDGTESFQLGVKYQSEGFILDYSTFQDVADTYYDRGYSEGETAGYSEGVIEGYRSGRDTGYDIGFNAGVASANDYSFISLIGAVVDVPVSAFQGLFNFEVLGINVAGFLLSLMTVGLIIAIVRFIM